MTQEDKELLLKDLCARLPYGVKITWDGKHSLTVTPHVYCAIISEDNIKNLPKIFLRPMSNVTDEEMVEFEELFIGYSISQDRNCVYHSRRGDLSMEIIDWLNAHHFDYRGLIEKGLAKSTRRNVYSF